MHRLMTGLTKKMFLTVLGVRISLFVDLRTLRHEQGLNDLLDIGEAEIDTGVDSISSRDDGEGAWDSNFGLQEDSDTDDDESDSSE
jgi:hypothetical protein